MTAMQRLAYGLLGAPLAMAALPVYIHTPSLYGDELGLGLALTGAILLGSRALDTLQDPWLGRLADLMQRQHRGWSFLAGAAAALLVLAYTALFYIADVLQLEAYSGLFLAIYFVSAALSLPIWLRLSRRFGRSLTWVFGTLVAVVGFIWAIQLGANDLIPYLLICLMSGTALGADLALPAAIAADIIPEEDRGSTGSYFGIWSLINKGVLALAAGLGLPLLAGFGYQPGGGGGLTALAIIYAGVPCMIKLLSAALLFRWRKSLEVHYAA